MPPITHENYKRICWSCGEDTGRELAEQSPYRPQHKQAEACGECESKFMKPVQFPCVICDHETGREDFRECSGCWR